MCVLVAELLPSGIDSKVFVSVAMSAQALCQVKTISVNHFGIPCTSFVGANTNFNKFNHDVRDTINLLCRSNNGIDVALPLCMRCNARVVLL